MKKIWKYFFLLLSTSVTAQNLVPNSSFEDTVACPDNLGQIDRAFGWSSYRVSPDYFNSCSVNGGFSGVPLNQFDFQYPRSGNAYAGFHTLITTVQNGREFLGIQLTQTLNIGQQYFASFFVNRVGVISGQGKNIATNKIGMRLSTAPYSVSNPAAINNYAQIYTDSIVTDTLNWIEISGFFTADSAYQYLSIGNFFVDSLTSHIEFDSAATAAYYFVDDVTLSILEGIEENDSFLSVKIFPNPTKDWITVEGKGIYKISLYDIFGKLCLKREVTPSSLLKIDLNHFAKGIYFVLIQTSRENITQKIIIQ